MPIVDLLLRLMLFVAAIHGASAATLELASPVQQAALVELYTSEGCSSCPPADRWLSQFKNDPRLWKNIVPVAFHVDYWNHLGWKDRFSDAGYTQRQHGYERYGYLGFVYTPGLVFNGREWRGWFARQGLPATKPDNIGVLKVTIDDNGVTAEFKPLRSLPSSLILNIALLAFDQTSDVSAGENRGKKLVHDFVVVDWRQFPQETANDRYHWTLDGLPSRFPVSATGIALWVTSGNDPTPLQATGGYLH